MNHLIFILTLFTTHFVYAGGTETIFAKLLDGGTETKPALLAGVDLDYSVILANPGRPSFEGGTETIYVDKIKYAGETADSVIVFLNDLESPVAISDVQLGAFPEVESAIKKSYDSTDWSAVLEAVDSLK